MPKLYPSLAPPKPEAFTLAGMEAAIVDRLPSHLRPRARTCCAQALAAGVAITGSYQYLSPVTEQGLPDRNQVHPSPRWRYKVWNHAGEQLVVLVAVEHLFYWLIGYNTGRYSK